MAEKTPGIEVETCAALTKWVFARFESGVFDDELEAPIMEALRFLWDQSNLLHDLVQDRPEGQGVPAGVTSTA